MKFARLYPRLLLYVRWWCCQCRPRSDGSHPWVAKMRRRRPSSTHWWRHRNWQGENSERLSALIKDANASLPDFSLQPLWMGRLWCAVNPPATSWVPNPPTATVWQPVTQSGTQFPAGSTSSRLPGSTTTTMCSFLEGGIQMTPQVRSWTILNCSALRSP